MHRLTLGARTLLGLDLAPAHLALFETYAAELRAWSERFNLTAITDDDGIQIKHFLDSLSLLKALPSGWGRARLVDVGTGAGFPGLPLKLLCPDLRLTLVEATGKKITFLQALVEKLRLTGVTVIKARAEDLGQDPAHREQYDFAVARAVAEMPVLAEYLLPLVRLGGLAIAQKGHDAPAEAHAAEHAVHRLGGTLAQVIPIELPGIVETRHLVVYSKTALTPPAYPRRPGVPAKSPLR